MSVIIPSWQCNANTSLFSCLKPGVMLDGCTCQECVSVTELTSEQHER
jgi:hypothetical protein